MMVRSNNIAGSNMLVVGGAGFVGSNLVKMLLANNAGGVTVVDNLLSSERTNLPDDPRLTFWEGSIADERVLAAIKDIFDVVFHLATFHGNQNSIHDPLADHDNNLITTLKLFNHIKAFKQLKKIVYSGAGCAVAEKTYAAADATSEDAHISLQMDSPYSISKIVGEFYAVYYYNRHKLPVVRARFQNVYGPGEILGAGQWRGTSATVWRNVIPTFIYKALKRESLPVENGGRASRDFIFIKDICQGLIACVDRGQPGDVYNLASGVETSILCLAEFINTLTSNTTPITFIPRRDWDRSGKRFGSAVKAERELNFKAKVGLEVGLGITIAWMRENMRVIEAAMARHIQHL